ncbi:hypothetical protein D3C77_437320 [compost metagenome]
MRRKRRQQYAGTLRQFDGISQKLETAFSIKRMEPVIVRITFWTLKDTLPRTVANRFQIEWERAFYGRKYVSNIIISPIQEVSPPKR